MSILVNHFVDFAEILFGDRLRHRRGLARPRRCVGDKTGRAVALLADGTESDIVARIAPIMASGAHIPAKWQITLPMMIPARMQDSTASATRSRVFMIFCPK
jgi:hypothetical protein